jgi:hypothetical protein
MPATPEYAASPPCVSTPIGRLSSWFLLAVFLVLSFALYLGSVKYDDERKRRNLLHANSAATGCMRVIVTDRIAVSVASFRDSRCATTVKQMFQKAAYPEHIVALVCEQNASAEEMCLLSEIEVGEVRMCSIPASKASGPCTARQKAAALWQGESIFLQIDAHTWFSQNWDVHAREMIAKAPVNNALFSTYAIDSEKDEGDYTDRDVPVLDDVWFTGHDQILQAATNFHQPGEIVPSRSIGGGYILAPGRMVAEVPLDPTLESLFQDEELLWWFRLFTSGWNVYSPTVNIVAHIYHRKDDHLPIHPESMDFGTAERQACHIIRETYGCERSQKSLDLGFGPGKVRPGKDLWKYMKFYPHTTPIDEHVHWDFREAFYPPS